MYYVILKLNEKGQKICKSLTREIEVNIDHYPSSVEIENAINNEFMLELVEEVVSIKSDFRNLNVGDVVKIIAPSKEGIDVVEYGEVKFITDSGYGHEILIQPHDIEHYDDYCYRNDIRFNFAGNEIGGSRKYKRYIEIANEYEVLAYNNGKNKCNLYNEVCNLIHHHEDWEDIDDNQMPLFITVDSLVAIKEMLEIDKKNYYEKN